MSFAYSSKESTMILFSVFILAFAGMTCCAQIPAGYYNSATGLSGPALKSALHNIIDDHYALSYDAATEALKVIDEDTLNPANVICIYTGWSYAKSAYGNESEQWNKEHVWAVSHGIIQTNPPDGSDLHNLRPCDASVNSAKGNRDFDEGTVQYIDGSGPTDCYTAPYIWEPRPSDKGDVARTLFYMAVRYEGDSGEPDLELVDYVNSAPNNEPYYGNLDTLLKWHIIDPVDNWERKRNDSIYYRYQGNRNPFIDHPEYVDMIWSTEPSYHASNFSAQNIVVSWDDATGAVVPDGYLLRRSTTGFSTIADPVDGVVVSSDSSNKYIAYGIGHCIFNDAAPGTVYYIKIFPYKGSGNSINYKTDGDIQQISIQFN